MSGSEVDVVEAAYRVTDRSTQAWLQGVADAAAPLLADGLGLTLAVYALPEALPVMGASRDTPSDYLEEGASYLSTVPEQVRRRTFGQGLYVGPGWELLGPEAAASMKNEMARRYGAAGAFGCIGRTLDDRSLYLHVATRNERPAEGRGALWRRVMIHLLAGFRLLPDDGESGRLDVAEAVLAPSGRIHHAQSEAPDENDRAALRRAVLDIDRARTRAGRADPAGALELWRGLVHGRWSLVETFDSDGRRFFAAQRNDPARGSDRRLSHRERQSLALAGLGWSNAEISYALGLSENTVGVYLTKALRKLGIPGRADLITLATAAEPGGWA